MINSGFFDPRSNDPMLCRDSLAVGIGAFSFKADGVEILVSADVIAPDHPRWNIGLVCANYPHGMPSSCWLN